MSINEGCFHPQQTYGQHRRTSSINFMPSSILTQMYVPYPKMRNVRIITHLIRMGFNKNGEACAG